MQEMGLEPIILILKNLEKSTVQ